VRLSLLLLTSHCCRRMKRSTAKLNRRVQSLSLRMLSLWANRAILQRLAPRLRVRLHLQVKSRITFDRSHNLNLAAVSQALSLLQAQPAPAPPRLPAARKRSRIPSRQKATLQQHMLDQKSRHLRPAISQQQLPVLRVRPRVCCNLALLYASITR
jgi:hypothetical protein